MISWWAMMLSDPQTAITEARRRRALRRQHFAVVQRGASLSVRELRKVKDKRIAWSTKDDTRARAAVALTPDDYDIIRQLYNGGMASAEIAEKFEISVPRVNRIAGTGHL